MKLLLSKQATKSAFINIAATSAIPNISYLCDLTDKCLDVAIAANYPLHFCELQKQILEADYLALVKNGEVKGFACFSEKENILNLDIIVLNPDVHRKGMAVKIINEVTQLTGCKYLTATLPVGSSLKKNMEKVHNFEKLSKNLYPNILTLEEKEGYETIVLKSRS